MRYPKPYKPKNRSLYYFAYVDKDGKHKRRSTGCERRSDADEEVRKFFDRLRARTSQATFADYSRPYFVWETCPRVSRRLKEGKQIGKTYVRHSRSLIDAWVIPDTTFSHLSLAQIVRGDILDLRDRLVPEIPGTNTLNKVIAAVKTVLSEAAFRGDIPTDPGARIGNVRYEQRERGAFSIEEVRKIIELDAGDMADPRMGAAIATLFCTGIRVGELRALRWASVADNGRARIHEAFQDSRAMGPVKWDKPREIVLPQLVRARLKLLKRKSGAFVFSDVLGRPLGIEGLKNAFLRVLAEASKDKDDTGRPITPILQPGDRWLTPHSCRHTLNTALLAAGMSPLLVQTYLGWSSQESRILTRVQTMYTHMQMLRLEDVAEKVDELYGSAKKEERKAT